MNTIRNSRLPLLAAVAVLGAGSRFAFEAISQDRRFGARVFHAPPNDPAGGGGGGGKTLEERLADAESRATDFETKSKVFETRAIAAEGKVTSLEAEVQRVTGQFTAMEKVATDAKADVTRLTGELSTATGNVTRLTGELSTVNTNLTRLESLCNVKGIDAKNAVPGSDSTKPGQTLSELEGEYAAAKTPAARNEIADKIQALASKKV